jgi:lysophospholipase L1-like esterase
MSRFKIILFSAVTIAVVFLILEFGDRALKVLLPEDSLKKPGTEALAFESADLSPYSFFGELPALELRPNNNFFYEFNNKKVAAKKESEEFRIFILGGSVAQGYGASSQEKKYYQILEKKLNKEKPKNSKKNFNVISAGRLGYVTGQELALMLMGILDFKPDMTLHLNGANDVIAVSQFHEIPGFPFYFQSLKKALEASKLEKKLDQTLGESVFLSDLKNMLKKYKSSAPGLMAKNIVRHYERNMKVTAQVLTANQISSFFFLQPHLTFKSNLSSKEKQHLKTLRKQSTQLWRSIFPIMAKSLEDISKNTGVHWKDLNSSLKNEKKAIFTDSVHLTDLGQNFLANIIFEEIKEELFAKNQKKYIAH